MAGYEDRILEGVNQILVPNSDRTYDEVLDQNDEQFEQDWQDWYENRKHWLNTPYGWLSLRSIDWLKDGETIRIKDFPGSWTQHGDSVVYTPDEGEIVTNRGEAITEPKTITVDTVADVNVEDFEHEGVRAQLIKRIGSDRQFAVRVRDPQSKTRSSFQEIPHYQPDKKWVFPARYVPSEQWGNVEVGAVLGDLKHNETQIGTLYVTINGKEVPLIVFQGHNDDSGWTEVDPETGKVTYLDNRQKTDGIGFVAFRDGTSGKTTYGGGRNIPVDVAHPESVKYADFNRATNPPCSFTVFCTCPFAPNQNVLPFAVEAGERIPEIVDFGD